MKTVEFALHLSWCINASRFSLIWITTALRLCSRFFSIRAFVAHILVFYFCMFSSMQLFFVAFYSYNRDVHLIVCMSYNALRTQCRIYLLFMPVQMNWDNGDWLRCALSLFQVFNSKWSAIDSLLYFSKWIFAVHYHSHSNEWNAWVLKSQLDFLFYFVQNKKNNEKSLARWVEFFWNRNRVSCALNHMYECIYAFGGQFDC